MKKKKIGATRILIVSIFMISSASCNLFLESTPAPEANPTDPPIIIYPTTDYSFQVHELNQNQAKWESQNITHYKMSVNDDADNVKGPVIVEVKDGNVVSVVDANDKVLFPNEDSGTTYSDQRSYTIERLFSDLAFYYSYNATSVGVTYDPLLGYPISVYIVPYSEPCCEDFSIEIREFQILSP